MTPHYQFSAWRDITGRTLPGDQYLSEDILALSQYLLGKVIVVKEGRSRQSGVIVEVEAYKGPEDKASHAYDGRRTTRTEVMFGQGGVAYVYLCYGLHDMFNVVSGKEDVPHAILVRAVEPLEGISRMLENRGLSKPKYTLTNGPGKLAQALGISRKFNGHRLTENDNLWIEDRGITVEEDDVVADARIGIDYAEEWVKKPWRFSIKGSPWVSTRPKKKGLPM